MNHSQLEGNRGERRSLSLKRPSNNCGLYISIYTILTLSKIHFSLWEQQQKVKGIGLEGLRGTPQPAQGKAQSWWQRRVAEQSITLVFFVYLFGDANVSLAQFKKHSCWIRGRKRGFPGKVWMSHTRQLRSRCCRMGQLCPAVQAVSVSQHSQDSSFSFRSAPCGVWFLPVTSYLSFCQMMHCRPAEFICRKMFRFWTVSPRLPRRDCLILN